MEQSRITCSVVGAMVVVSLLQGCPNDPSATADIEVSYDAGSTGAEAAVSPDAAPDVEETPDAGQIPRDVPPSPDVAEPQDAAEPAEDVPAAPDVDKTPDAAEMPADGSPTPDVDENQDAVAPSEDVLVAPDVEETPDAGEMAPDQPPTLDVDETQDVAEPGEDTSVAWDVEVTSDANEMSPDVPPTPDVAEPQEVAEPPEDVPMAPDVEGTPDAGEMSPDVPPTSDVAAPQDTAEPAGDIPTASDAEDTPDAPPAVSQEQCDDLVDNDDNGLVDCDDPGCAGLSGCACPDGGPTPPEPADVAPGQCYSWICNCNCTSGSCACAWQVDVKATCDDGDPCTEADACDDSSACHGVPAPGPGCPTLVETFNGTPGVAVCPGVGDCLLALGLPPACHRWSCAISPLGCQAIPVPVGSLCDDGDPCTAGDACDVESKCAGTQFASETCPCASHDQCPPGETACDIAVCMAGSCSIQSKPGCAIDGTCYSPGVQRPPDLCAVCVPDVSTTSWTPVDCDNGLACAEATCQAGACQTTLYPGSCLIDGTCYAAQETAPGDACQVCAPDQATAQWTAISCDDADVCTQDHCATQEGCVHLEVPSLCDDDDACTVDSCESSVGCQHELVDCADAEPCTVDTCAPEVGCAHTWLDCADGNACTKDFCEDDVCVHSAVSCDDGAVCTADSCLPSAGCQHLDLCDDGNPCTEDSCVVPEGVCSVVPTAEGEPACDLIDPCVGGEVCQDGECGGGVPLGLVLALRFNDKDALGQDTSGQENHAEVVQPALALAVAGPHPSAGGGYSLFSLSDCLCPNPNGDQGHRVRLQDAPLHQERFTVSARVTSVYDLYESADDGIWLETFEAGLRVGLGGVEYGQWIPFGDRVTEAKGETTITVVKDHDTLRVYLDGALDSETSLQEEPPATEDTTLYLGASPTKELFGLFFGLIDDVHWFNDALTPAQVGALTSGTVTCSSCLTGECHDQNPCTLDTCTATEGCANLPISRDCDDGDACTALDVCSDGACAGVIAPACDDFNPCTQDACQPDVGCTASPVADNTPCDDGDACALADACHSGQCGGGWLDVVTARYTFETGGAPMTDVSQQLNHGSTVGPVSVIDASLGGKAAKLLAGGELQPPAAALTAQDGAFTARLRWRIDDIDTSGMNLLSQSDFGSSIYSVHTHGVTTAYPEPGTLAFPAPASGVWYETAISSDGLFVHVFRQPVSADGTTVSVLDLVTALVPMCPPSNACTVTQGTWSYARLPTLGEITELATTRFGGSGHEGTADAFVGQIDELEWLRRGLAVLPSGDVSPTVLQWLGFTPDSWCVEPSCAPAACASLAGPCREAGCDGAQCVVVEKHGALCGVDSVCAEWGTCTGGACKPTADRLTAHLRFSDGALDLSGLGHHLKPFDPSDADDGVLHSGGLLPDPALAPGQALGASKTGTLIVRARRHPDCPLDIRADIARRDTPGLDFAVSLDRVTYDCVDSGSGVVLFVEQPVGEWHTLAVAAGGASTFGGGDIVVYRDGAPVETVPCDGSLTPAIWAAPLELQGDCSEISDVWWFDRALGPAEIASVTQGTAVLCMDADPCSLDACGPSGCIHTPLDCDDGDPCTLDVCADSGCVHPPKCDAATTACAVSTCSPIDGNCELALVDGACEDGDACTAGDSCQNGECASGAVLNCQDGDPCTHDFCNADFGCTNPPLCDDGNPCSADQCDDGQCSWKFAPQGVCPNPLGACATASCDASTWKCTSTPIDCDDQNACTADYCTQYEATPGCQHLTKTCQDDDPCTLDLCDPVTGACSFPAVDCDDGDACTTEGCQTDSGACAVTTTVGCDDGLSCTDDACNPTTGACESASNCSDGNGCTVDHCANDDTCYSVVAAGAACDDNDPCTVEDTCSNSAQCVGEQAPCGCVELQPDGSTLHVTCDGPNALILETADGSPWMVEDGAFKTESAVHASGGGEDPKWDGRITLIPTLGYDVRVGIAPVTIDAVVGDIPWPEELPIGFPGPVGISLEIPTVPEPLPPPIRVGWKRGAEIKEQLKQLPMEALCSLPAIQAFCELLQPFWNPAVEDDRHYFMAWVATDLLQNTVDGMDLGAADGATGVTSFDYQSADMAAILAPGDQLGLLKASGAVFTLVDGPLKGAALGISGTGKVHQESVFPLPLAIPPGFKHMAGLDGLFDHASLDGHLYQYAEVAWPPIEGGPEIFFAGELLYHVDPDDNGWFAPTILKELMSLKLGAFYAVGKDDTDALILMNGASAITQDIGYGKAKPFKAHLTFAQSTIAVDTRQADPDDQTDVSCFSFGGCALNTAGYNPTRRRGIRMAGILGKVPELPEEVPFTILGPLGSNNAHAHAFYVAEGWWELGFTWDIGIPWQLGGQLGITGARVRLTPLWESVQGVITLLGSTFEAVFNFQKDGSWEGRANTSLPLHGMVITLDGAPLTIDGKVTFTGDAAQLKHIMVEGALDAFGLVEVPAKVTLSPTADGGYNLDDMEQGCVWRTWGFDWQTSGLDNPACGDNDDNGLAGGLAGSVCLKLGNGYAWLQFEGSWWLEACTLGCCDDYSSDITVDLNSSGEVCVDFPIIGEKCPNVF